MSAYCNQRWYLIGIKRDWEFDYERYLSFIYFKDYKNMNDMPLKCTSKDIVVSYQIKDYVIHIP